MDALLEERAMGMIRWMTGAEQALWEYAEEELDSLGWQLQPQVVLGRFIVDFYVESVRLAIEIDGPQHAEAEQQRRDEWRTRQLEAAVQGLKVLRFTNGEVLADMPAVAEHIKAVCQERWNRAQLWAESEREERKARQERGLRPFRDIVRQVLQDVWLDAWLCDVRPLTVEPGPYAGRAR